MQPNQITEADKARIFCEVRKRAMRDLTSDEFGPPTIELITLDDRFDDLVVSVQWTAGEVDPNVGTDDALYSVTMDGDELIIHGPAW